MDVEHQIDKTATKGFVVKDFIKPTAKTRTFLNGRLHNPIHVIKAITTGEAIRMRCLNENDEYYIASLERLQQKCNRSDFDEKITSEIIQQAKKMES